MWVSVELLGQQWHGSGGWLLSVPNSQGAGAVLLGAAGVLGWRESQARRKLAVCHPVGHFASKIRLMRVMARFHR